MTSDLVNNDKKNNKSKKGRPCKNLKDHLLFQHKIDEKRDSDFFVSFKYKNESLNNSALNVYLRDISKYPLLSKEEELSLFEKVKKGNKEAKQKLVKHNLRLVINIAKNYIKSGLPFFDLVQEGNVGLLKAIEKFDYSKGFRFSTYASWWIKKEISTAIINQSNPIRIPRYVIELFNEINRIEQELFQENYKKPSVEEISKHLPKKITAKKIIEIQEYMQKTFSVDASIPDAYISSSNDFSIFNRIDSDKDFFIDDTYGNISHFLKKLTPKEETIIRLRYGLDDNTPKTLEEIGRLFNVSRERIRQIEAKAIFKLQQYSSIININ